MVLRLALFSLVATLALAGRTDTIDNGISADPTVDCSTDSLTVNFATQKEFEGHVYVKGHYADSACRIDATLTHAVNLTIPFESCDVRRQRSSNPKGLYVSVTIIITFHPMFITKVDKSYNVQCFYTEVEKTVTTQMDVSMGRDQEKKLVVLIGDNGERREIFRPLLGLSPNDREANTSDLAFDDQYNQLQTEVLTQSIPLPICRYSVLQEGPKGAPVKFATVGQQVYHQWTCEPDPATENDPNSVFCATVHSCNVREEGGKEVQLLDENGCAVDKFLLNNLEYTSDLSGGQVSQVFKFADQPSLFFQCQIRLSLKEGPTCKRSSDDCPAAARGKRSLEEEEGEGENGTKKKDGSEVDVFSQSMTVFEIDDPITPTAASELGEGVWDRRSMCVTPLTFGLLIALLVTVLLISVLVTIIACLRPQAVKVKMAG